MKKWYQSKTIWTNIIAFILSFVPFLDAATLAALGITNTQLYLTILGLVTFLLNGILRLITTKGIETNSNATDIGGGTVGTPR
jgi:hypothetical protein